MPLDGNRSLFFSSVIEKLCKFKVSEKDETNSTSKWKDLPDEILELILKRLCLTDYLALTKVCSPWRKTVINAIANKNCYPLPELPLIFLISTVQASLFSLRTEREYHPKISTLFGSMEIAYHGSVEGWLIMSNLGNGGFLIFFFNPVTNRFILVPPPLYFPSDSPIECEELFLGKMVASSNPDCYQSSSGCYLSGLFGDCNHIAFYRLFDKSWNMIETDKDSGVHFLDLEIMGSKLYVSSTKHFYSILVYDLQDSSNGSPKLKVSVVSVTPQISTPYVSRIIDSQCHDSGHVVYFLAQHESLEQLFLIYTICNIIYKPEDINHLNMIRKFVTSHEITAMEVFKMDLNKASLEWIKCESLDDNVIFASYFKSVVMSRAALNSTDQELIQENSVYFALSPVCASNPWQGVQLGIKHLTHNNIKYFSIEKSNHSEVPRPFWFVPVFENLKYMFAVICV